MALIPTKAIRFLANGLDHPEGVACGPDGFVYAGGEAGQIYRVDPETGKFAQIGSTGGFILGLALDAAANVYACDLAAHCVKRIAPDGTVSTYSAGAPGVPMRTPNYPVFDSRGNLYVSDSGEWEQDDGLVFRVRPGGETEVWSRGPRRFSNGMALHPSGAYLYVAESLLPGVSRVAISPDGSAGATEQVVTLAQTVPDGLAFDRAGNLYIACYRPDRIYRLRTTGELEVVADDWTGAVLAAPTNIAFFGPDLGQVVVASLGRWALTAFDAEHGGQPLHYPSVG